MNEFENIDNSELEVEIGDVSARGGSSDKNTTAEEYSEWEICSDDTSFSHSHSPQDGAPHSPFAGQYSGDENSAGRRHFANRIDCAGCSCLIWLFAAGFVLLLLSF